MTLGLRNVEQLSGLLQRLSPPWIRRAVQATATLLAVPVFLLSLGYGSAATAELASKDFRAIDTRLQVPGPPIIPGAGGTNCDITVSGVNGIPRGAYVAINITSVQAAGRGYITAYADDKQRPDTSSLNFASGNVSNNTIVESGGDTGQICVYNSAATHYNVDVVGWFARNDYQEINNYPDYGPIRVGDTRDPDYNQPARPLRAGEERCYSVTPQNSGARSVFVNVTAIQPAGAGFLRLYPNGIRKKPDSSNLNFAAGETIGNGSLVQVGVDKEICLTASVSTHVTVDLLGRMQASSSLQSVRAIRSLDTRETGSKAPIAAGAGVCGRVKGIGSVPWTATDVFVNITAVGPASNAWFSAYPEGVPQQTTSVLNAPANGNRANGAWVPVGNTGKICVYNSQATHIIIDVLGYDIDQSAIPEPPPSFATFWYEGPSKTQGPCYEPYREYAGSFKIEGPQENNIIRIEYLGTEAVLPRGLFYNSYWKVSYVTRFSRTEKCSEFGYRFLYDYTYLPSDVVTKCAIAYSPLRLHGMHGDAIYTGSPVQGIPEGNGPCPGI